MGKAADATTDILEQFHLGASDLPMVVDRVSGALDASKLSFDSYKDAIGQVGGIAGGLGYSFEDMNSAIAAVVPLMTGGSDAGTSFKTFLLSLVPSSKEAERQMDALGISFFDTMGNTKSLAEVAEELNTKLAKLTQKRRQDVLTTIFGTDGMRVALALMQAGAKGVEDVQARINAVTADQKLAVLLEGEAAATARLAASWEKLKIAIGEAGIIQALTLIKNTVAMTTEAISRIPAPFFYAVNAAALLAAAMGPALLVISKVAPAAVGAALASGRFGLALTALGSVAGAILNPIGFFIGLMGRMAIGAGAATIIGRLGIAMLRFATPIGLAVTALSFLLPALLRQTTASQVYTNALDKARDATETSTDVINKLAFAQGKAKVEALAMARADRIRAAAAIATARADLQAARAASMRARAQSSSIAQKAYEAASFGSSDWERGIDKKVAGFFGWNIAPDRMQAAVDQQAAADVLGETLKRFDALDTAIKNAENGLDIPATGLPGDEGGAAKKKDRAAGGKSAADLAREAALAEARYQDDLGQSRIAQLRAQADLTDSARARYAAEMTALAEERAAYQRQIANDDDLTAAKRVTLMAEKDRELATRRAIAEQDLSIAAAQESYDLARARNEAEQELTRFTIDAADSVSARRSGELRLLELQRHQEEADLDLILATRNTATVEWANAAARKEQLDGIYAARAEQIKRQNEGPGASYMRWLERSPVAIGEDLQDGAVSALKDLNTQLSDAILGAGNLANAFASMGKRIIASLLDIAIQQSIIKPLAQGLFGGGGLFGAAASFKPDRALLGGNMDATTALLTRSGGIPFGGGRATGGPVEPNRWYMVGEEGPEPFYSGIRGTVLPNSALNAGPRQSQAAVVQIVADEGAMFVPRVQSISGEVSVETVGAANASMARMQRRRLGR